jgi:ribonuclease P protein component
MLLSENRLKKVRDFNLLIKKGRWVNGRFFDLKYLELAKFTDLRPKTQKADEFLSQLKIAFGVGLRISKSAVKRNRLRRQLSEAVRLFLKTGRVKPGYFFLFSAKAGSLGATYEQITQEVEFLFKAANLVNR